MKLNDTIAAIATPRGAGGVAIIRISGEFAEEIAAKIVKPNNKKSVTELKNRQLTLCQITSGEDNGFLIDEALVAVMRAPKSYTGENVVEINCHGGFLVADKILGALLKSGARLAEAGEFTRRAFINGKTDLSGAEAVMDMMNSHTESGLHNAAMSLTGAIRKKIEPLRNSVMELAAHISAAADYPDEVELPEPEEMQTKLYELIAKTESLLGGFETGRMLRDGVRTAIVGKPNVGKSSVLNALLRCERAIVTDIPGTTRDTIEEFISIGGVALQLSDTAGIRDAADEVEKIGIERSKENLRGADLCLFVIDASGEITDEDREVAEALGGKKTIVILNKTDKQIVTDEKTVGELGLACEAIVKTSAPKGVAASGIDELERVISDMFVSGKVNPDEVYIANERQRDCLLKAKAALSSAADGLSALMPTDLVFVDLEDALASLGEVTGETVQEEIIDNVFARFCVGK